MCLNWLELSVNPIPIIEIHQCLINYLPLVQSITLFMLSDLLRQLTRLTIALEHACSAQEDWKQRPLAERKKLCSAAVDAFVANKADIAEEICWQMGRPIASAAGEVAGMEERARKMIELADAGLSAVKLDEKEGFERWIQREALGVMFVIAPWNYPYLTAINAIMPALLAGNAVVLKHSAQTPLCAERLHQAFVAGGLPDGVFQYLHLNHADTETIIKDARINHVAFTGSVAGW